MVLTIDDRIADRGTLDLLVPSIDTADVLVEVFPIFLRAGTLHYVHPADASSLQIQVHSSEHPRDVVSDAIAQLGSTSLVIHSTSWRFEKGSLILSYLVAASTSGPLSEGMRATSIVRRNLARGTATQPPQTIDIEEVVEHGLRHLAWLVRDDPAVRDALREEWAGTLDAYYPQPFSALDLREAPSRWAQLARDLCLRTFGRDSRLATACPLI